jgi:hypothetical protein
LIKYQLLFYIGYFVSFWGVFKSYMHQISFWCLVKIKGSYTQLDQGFL